MTSAETPPAPRALEAVRDLERALDVDQQARTATADELGEARRRAAVLLEAARARGEQASRRAREETLARAERQADAIRATADEQVAALQRLVEASGAAIVAELRSLVLPGA